jgi:hypothetical protein
MRGLAAIAVALAMILATSNTAQADQAQVDNDLVAPGNQNRVSVTAAPGATVTIPVTLTLTRSGSHVGENVTVTFVYDAHRSTNVPSGATVSSASITTPAGWACKMQGQSLKPQSCTHEYAGAEVLSATSYVTFAMPALTSSSTMTVKWSAIGAFDSNDVTGSPDLTVDLGANVLTTPPPADTTPPVISVQVTGTEGTGGWYVSNVVIDWTVEDAESTVLSSSGCNDQSVISDTTEITFTCTATSAGGTDTRSVTIKRDATKPVIAFSGATDYTVDQTVAISCSATDATSGIASATCPGPAGDAYTFAIGTNTLAASATDGAGNSESATYSFTVRVTADSLCNLTRRFATKPLGNSLCAQLSAAAAAAARGNEKAKANALAAYTREVNAQTGKAFIAGNAAILTSLASYLTN